MSSPPPALSGASPEPRLRADAERNRAAILCAAQAAFSSGGLGVTREEIAKRAGVGIGTVYRRFPTHEALVTAILEEKVAAYADRAEQAVDEAATQPWEAFERFLWYLLEQQQVDVALGEAILSPDGTSELFRCQLGRAFEATLRLVDQVKAARVVVDDFEHYDIQVLLVANLAVARAVSDECAARWRAHATAVLSSFHRDPQA